jgi:hypothetical protein
MGDQKDTHHHNGHQGTKVPRSNGEGMSYHHRSTDVDDQIFRARYGKVIYWAGAIILASFIAGSAYVSLTLRLSSVECKTQLLVDVVVFKKGIKDIRTDC